MRVIQRVLKQIMKFASRDETRENICSLAITEAHRGIATNGEVLAIYTPVDGVERCDIWQDTDVPTAYVRDGVDAVVSGARPTDLIEVSGGAAEGRRSSAQLAETDCFPAWKQVLPRKFSVRVRVDPSYLKQVAEAALSLSARTASAKEPSLLIRIPEANEHGVVLQPLTFEASGDEGTLHMILMPMRL